MKLNLPSIWRAINVVLIVLLFAGPWFLNPGDILPFNDRPLRGWQVIWNYSFGIGYSIESDLIPYIDWVVLIPFLLIAFGGISTAAYTICSITLLISKNKTILYRYARFLLICGSPILLVVPLKFMIGRGENLLWGYWVGMSGLFSSFVLEWATRKSRVSDIS